MRILVLIYCIDSTHGGTSRSSTNVISKLSAQFPDVDITLLTRYSPNPVLRTFDHPNAKIVFSRSLLSAVLFNFRLLRTFDVVHVQGLWTLFPTFLGILVKLCSKASLVVSPRGMLEPWSLQQGRFKKILALNTYQGLLFKLTDVFHVTAGNEAKSLSTINPENRHIIIPNGLDTTQYINAGHYREVDTRTILFLSRIHKKKGIDMLIEAWSILEADWPNWRVRIVGDGDSNYIQSLKKQVTASGLKNIKVEEPLYGIEKIMAYSSADIFVLPSYSENFGIVIAEALASGLPVITTTGTPWSDVVDENCGEYIDPTAHELGIALRKWLASTPDQRRQAGLRGKKLVHNKYSLDLVASSFYSLYQSYIRREVE